MSYFLLLNLGVRPRSQDTLTDLFLSVIPGPYTLVLLFSQISTSYLSDKHLTVLLLFVSTFLSQLSHSVFIFFISTLDLFHSLWSRPYVEIIRIYLDVCLTNCLTNVSHKNIVYTCD